MNPYRYYNENGLRDPGRGPVLYPIKHVAVERRRGYYFTTYDPNSNPIVVTPIGFTGVFSNEPTDETELLPLLSIFKTFHTRFRNTTPIESKNFLEQLNNEAVPNFNWERHEQFQPISLDPQALPQPFEVCLVAIEREYLDLLGEQLYVYCETDNHNES